MTNLDLLAVNSKAEIPEFATEEEYIEFWQTHSFGPGLLEEGKLDPDVQALRERIAPRTRPRQPRQPKATHVTTLRLDGDMQARLKRVAALKKVPYQTLLKQFVGERLYEEEKRLGVL